MVILEDDGIEVDFCPDCRGVWLDEGELEQLLHGREAALRLIDWKSGAKGKRHCPRCTAAMRIVHLPNSGPEIDVCPEACGIWFDRGELRAAVRAHLGESDAGAVVQRLTTMLGALPE
jgi:Zn-finger nucleic acid-binding protein